MTKTTSSVARGHVQVTPTPEISNWSIALVGNFTPGIFSPAWFDLHGVVKEEIAENAQIGANDAAKFNIKLGDINIYADSGIFEIRTEYPPEDRILDIAITIFGELLPDTKITAFGIHRYVHFKAASSDKRLEMFREMAPEEYWGPIGMRISRKRDFQTGGLKSIVIRETLDDDDCGGYMEVTVQPSAILGGKQGMFVFASRYYEMNNVTAQDGATKTISKLSSTFTNAIGSCDEAILYFIRRAS